MDQRVAAPPAPASDPVAHGAAPRAAEQLGCAALLLFAAVLLLAPLPSGLMVPLAAGCGVGSLALARSLAGLRNRTGAVVGDAVVLAAFALARDGSFGIWQLPTKWADVVGLTPVGAVTATLIYAAAGMVLAAQSGRDLAPRERGALFLLPLLFCFVLSLGNGGMMHDLGSAWTLGIRVPEPVDLVAGRWLVLFVFCEVSLGLCRVLVAGRLNRDWRYHALLLGAALHAAMAPHLADLPPLLGAAPGAQGIVAVAAAAVAQAGLWALVYIVTGLAIDALNGVPPTYATAYGQWRSGGLKGLIYGGVFIAIVVVGSAVLTLPGLVSAARAFPVLPGLIVGAALFPLALTVISSADGTPPFFGRLAANYRKPRLLARGAVVGLGIALCFALDVPHETGITRFVAGLALGALAYAGVDLAADAVGLARGQRRMMATWQVYALGAVLGGAVAGAIGWYFEADQIGVVATKFWSYADLDFARSGRKVEPFAIYPLFNKYGTIDLGPSGNGVRLFFNESLSGVINWGIAAPLFSINYFVLAAVFQRSLSPLKQLLSAKGFEGLVEQAVRVLRWGLWMAPVINSFLRQSPDPSWYNQDGAVRTGAATVADLFLPAGSFKSWSVSVFTGLLAYDWLRILIWFDHMGLRVATLVNLTFIGGDRLDEAAARFTGHAGRTRVIPEGIRRFATWAPLLIPFYIPHGPDWDRAWTGAEAIGRVHPPVVAPVWSVVGVYVGAVFLAGFGFRAVARSWNGARPSGAPTLPGVPRAMRRGPKLFRLANGAMTAEISADGRGYTAVTAMARGSHAIDVTRQPLDPLDLRGPFVFVRDAASDGAGLPQAWSLGYEPMRRAGPDYEVSQPDPATIALRNSADGIRAEAWVSLAEGRPLEYTRLVLTNTGDRPRTIELTTYRELAVHELGAYLRDPDFNALHVESWFVAELGAVLARNRLLRDPATHRMSHETVFHAVRFGDGARLVGYEDSRTRFIGPGGLRDPRGLGPEGRRVPGDEGSLYTFDPAASLTVAVEIAPKARAELLLLTGRAVNEWEAAKLIALESGRPAPDEAAFRAVLRRKRLIAPGPVLPASTWPFRFSTDTRLALTPSTPRSWAHVMANPTGFGTLVSNEGEVHTFKGNERQNAITPFRFESGATTLPGQFIAVVDLATGEADAPGFVPFRRPDAVHTVEYRLGAATFTNRRGDLELVMTVFVFSDAPADVRILTLRNHGATSKRYRVVPYMEIALDQSPGDSLGLLDAVRDEGTEALFFENPHNDFQGGWAFAATSLTAAMTETVRSRFIGSPGRDLASAVMVETGWPDGAQTDDGRRVAAFSGEVTVPAGGTVDVSVVMGQFATRREALTAASHLRDPAAARAALKATEAWWAERIGAIRIETDDPAFDRLVNHWLPYQALASRLWGRTGPNQRGGAFGFRDQLQDVLPFLFFDPSLTRRQIVIHSGVQFPGRRRLQMVASGDRRARRLGPADPRLGPAPVVALRADALRGSDGRLVGARRAPALSRRRRGAGRRHGPAVGAAAVARDRRRLRPLRPRHPVHDGQDGGPRPAVDRHRRLERRHRRRRAGRARRRHVARLLLLRHRSAFRRGRRSPGRAGRGRRVPRRSGPAGRSRGRGVDRRPLRVRLRRRWTPARPAVRHGGGLAGAQRRGPARKGAAGAGTRARRIGEARPHPPRHPALRRGLGALPWPHRRLPAGCARERRPIHARRILGGRRLDGGRASRARRRGRRGESACPGARGPMLAGDLAARQNGRRQPRRLRPCPAPAACRHLRRRQLRRPRRMELVHGLCGPHVVGRLRDPGAPDGERRGSDARRPPCAAWRPANQAHLGERGGAGRGGRAAGRRVRLKRGAEIGTTSDSGSGAISRKAPAKGVRVRGAHAERRASAAASSAAAAKRAPTKAATPGQRASDQNAPPSVPSRLDPR